MVRLSAVAVALAQVVGLALGASPVQPAPGLPGPDDPWPGFVPGGQFYRNIDWGVSFWGPGQADQQFQANVTGLLVRYSVPGQKDQPGWVISVVASRVKEELAPDALLEQSANQLRQGLGGRLSNLKLHRAGPAGAGGPGLAIGRLSCQIAPDRASAVQQPIHRTYLYLRLRPKQFLTLVAETTPAGAEPVEAVLDLLARSVCQFDPQAESRAIGDAAERTARLVEDLKPADWAELAAKAPAQWLRFHAAGPPGTPESSSTGPRSEPAVIGYGYQATVVRGPDQVEAISSSRLSRAGAALAGYRSAWVNLSTGQEVIREWSRTTPPSGQKGPAIETFLTARRSSSEDGDFEVSEPRPAPAGGQTTHTYSAKVQGPPYLPLALDGLLARKTADQPGRLFGAFTFQPVRGQVTFQTLQVVGPETAELEPSAEKVRMVQFRVRPAVSLPQVVQWTDPTGSRLLRVTFQPGHWADAVDEQDVPASARAELTRPPNWP